jgi:hypothetical protein
MADKAIGSLTLATTFGVSDRIVLEQDNTAKAITGQTLISLLATALDGHGGIDSLAKTSSTGTNPVIDTWTFTMADATTMSFQVTNGIKGDTGSQTYVWIKYASHEPTQDSDMTTTPDAWIGIYVGTTSPAPSHYTSYVWYQYKGSKGDTGDPAVLTDAEVVYQEGTSGTSAPTGTWTTTVPSVAQGNYLWTRTTLDFNTGSPVVSYAVARIGIDGTGTGTVQSVNDIQPDANGDVTLNAGDIPTPGGSDVATDLSSLSTAVANKANPSVATSVTIAVADWSNKACTKSVSGVTASNNIVVAPAPASHLAYGEAQIRATAQGSGTVSFACESVPDAAVTVNVLIVG